MFLSANGFFFVKLASLASIVYGDIKWITTNQNALSDVGHHKTVSAFILTALIIHFDAVQTLLSSIFVVNV